MPLNMTPEERRRKAPQVGDRVTAVSIIHDNRTSVQRGESGQVSRRLATSDGHGYEDIEVRWDSGAITITSMQVWDQFLKKAGTSYSGWMGSMFGGGSEPRIGDTVKAIATMGAIGEHRVTIDDVGKVQTIAADRYGTQQMHIVWKVHGSSMSYGPPMPIPFAEWRQWIKKVNLDELDLEEKIKRAGMCSVLSGIVTHLFALGLIVWYFGPTDWTDDKVKKLSLWTILPVVSVLPWVPALSMKKELAIPGLMSLVAVCLVAGMLTVTHCFIFPRSQALHPLAQVPDRLVNVTHHAATNALVCWSDNTRVSTFNSFMRTETRQSTGVDVQSAAGIAFSSMVSPIVPLAVGAVFYFMFIGEFDVFWFAPMRSKTVAVDILDCIVMWDTVFAHDPYFVFEDTSVGIAFSWVFLPIVGVWWLLATFQLKWEFQKTSAESETLPGGISHNAAQQHLWRGMSLGLNFSFLALRIFLRVKAQYCAPIMMLKNCTIWIPNIFPKDKKIGEGSIYEKVHSLTAEVRDYRRTLEDIMRRTKTSLEDDRRRYEMNKNGHHGGGAYGGGGGYNSGSNSPSYELDKMIEGREKLTGRQGFLVPGGQLYQRIQTALDYCNDKTDIKSRRNSVASPEELKAKVQSHLESIQSEVKCVSTETDIIFKKMEQTRRNGGSGGQSSGGYGGGGGGDTAGDAGYISLLHDTLGVIKQDTLKILELHRDKEILRGGDPHGSYEDRLGSAGYDDRHGNIGIGDHGGRGRF